MFLLLDLEYPSMTFL